MTDIDIDTENTILSVDPTLLPEFARTAEAREAAPHRYAVWLCEQILEMAVEAQQRAELEAIECDDPLRADGIESAAQGVVNRAEADLAAARAAVVASDEPALYTLRDPESGVTEIISCAGDAEAHAAAAAWAREGITCEDSTLWVDVQITREDGESLDLTITIDPEEPECPTGVSSVDIAAVGAALVAAGYDPIERGSSHGWRLASMAPESGGETTEPGSPWDEECDAILDDVRTALDGLPAVAEWADDDIVIDITERESGEHEWADDGAPGFGAVVRGHGGGVLCRSRCRHCGLVQTTDTWAQRPDTGEQGLTSVRYSADAHDDDDDAERDRVQRTTRNHAEIEES